MVKKRSIYVLCIVDGRAGEGCGMCVCVNAYTNDCNEL